MEGTEALFLLVVGLVSQGVRPVGERNYNKGN